MTNEQKLLSAFCHLAIFVSMPVIGPLIVYFVTQDNFIKTQAKEALAFNIAVIIGIIISAILCIIIIGIPLLLGMLGIGVVLPVIAAVKVIEGEDYRYPVTSKFIRR